MAYPDHYLLSFGGPMGVGEQWTNNIRFISDQVLGPSEQQDMCVQAKAALQTWMAGASSGFSTRCSLDHVKFNRIDGDGHYVSPSATNQLVFAPVACSGYTSLMPNNVALVASWITQFARGPGSKGRIFIPAPNVSITSATGRVSAAQCLAVANAAAVFLNAVNQQGGILAGFDLEASVVSSRDGKKGRITGVRVGDVPDTQRRRRNQYVEVYSLGTTAVTDT